MARPARRPSVGCSSSRPRRTPLSSLPPAGWYPDTTRPGQQRWWDGERWTDYTAPLGPTADGRHAAPAGGWPQLASFGQRLGASLLDALVVSVPLTILVFLVGVLFVLGLGAGSGFEGGDAAAGGLLLGGFVLFGVLLLVATVAPVVYAIGFEGSTRGQTIGKWAVGIRVVDGRTAGRLPLSRAAVRVIVRSFASGLLLLGYLWMLWDDQKRTWHDLAADSRVVVEPGPKPTLRELLRTWTLRG